MAQAARGDGVDSVLSDHGASDGIETCSNPLGTQTAACSPNVFVNGTGVVRIGDAVAVHTHVGCGTESPGLSSCSGTVFINGKGAGRNGDVFSANTITSGSPNVNIGD